MRRLPRFIVLVKITRLDCIFQARVKASNVLFTGLTRNCYSAKGACFLFCFLDAEDITLTRLRIACKSNRDRISINVIKVPFLLCRNYCGLAINAGLLYNLKCCLGCFLSCESIILNYPNGDCTSS